MGAVYLSCVDKWQVYAEAFDRTRDLCQDLLWGGRPPSEDPAPVQPAADGAGEEEEEAVPEGQKSSQTGTRVSDGDTGTPAGQDAPDGGEPVYMTVGDDYFSDAVFIGDSRTVGLYEYGGLEEISTFYASKGLTVYKMLESPVVEVPYQRKKLTIEEALQRNSFQKIYLMVGINEMGTGTVETFVERYEEVADHLLELQPDAILYIQGIMKVTAERSGQGDYITNEGIEERNQALARLADNKRIFYLDVNPLICDETGGMDPDYTFDGVHLKAQYMDIWKDYLKEHAVDLGGQLQQEQQ